MACYDWLLFGKADGDLPEPSSLYGYTPTTTVCVAFIVLFGISAGESSPSSLLCASFRLCDHSNPRMSGGRMEAMVVPRHAVSVLHFGSRRMAREVLVGFCSR